MRVLDPEAAQLFRWVVQFAGERLATPADLRRAVEHPAATDLPPSRLRADAALATIVRRATALAQTRAHETIVRADILDALVESEAVARGLDLPRLRFARWRLGRAYGEMAHLRQCTQQRVTVPREEER